MLEDVKVLVGEGAADQIRELAGRLTTKGRAALVTWLEGLTAEKLLDGGIALAGSLSGLYQFRNAMFTLRFIVRDDTPVVTQVVRNA